MKKTSSNFVVIKKSKLHGKGGFAKRDIPKGTKIIEYVGEKITRKEGTRRGELQESKSEKKKNVGSVYIFELNSRYDIDGSVPWNTAKYINHSCEPNAENDIIKNHIWIIATRKIKKGEEITYNYEYDADFYKDHPCRCGVKKCPGYILNKKYWKRIKKMENRKS